MSPGMLLDLAALLILGLFAGMGALRGGLSTFTGLASLVSGYAAAVWAAKSLAGPLAEMAGTSELIAAPAIGTAAFLVAALAVAVLGAIIKSVVRERTGGDPPGAASRWLGAFFGATRGALIVVLLAWLAIWLDAARQTGAFAGLDSMPETDRSLVVRATGAVVETAVAAAVEGDGPGSKLMARLASRPGEAVVNLQAILADARIEALQRDRFFWTLVENRAFYRAMNRSSFRAISRDEAMRRRLAAVGIISDEAAADPAVFDEAAAQVLAQIGPKIKALQDDPELMRLAEDPKVVAMLESGDTIGLIRHDGIQRIVSRVSAAE